MKLDELKMRVQGDPRGPWASAPPAMNEIVRLALEEDIGTGDVTSIACVPETRMAAGRFLAREPLTLARCGTALGDLPTARRRR